MEEVNRELLERRNYFQRISAQGTSYDTTQAVDHYITGFVKGALRLDAKTRNDRVILEDEDVSIQDTQAEATWIGDVVDATDKYVDAKGGEDFGSALMVINSSGELIASLYLMPAKGTVHLAIGGKGVWRNGEPLNRQQLTPRVAIVRWPRKRSVVPWDIADILEQQEVQLPQASYEVQQGQDLTAADVLSLAEGEIAKYLYYSKPWDFLIGAAIARAAEANVQWYDSSSEMRWKNVFPLEPRLIDIASRRDILNRVLFRVERNAENA